MDDRQECFAPCALGFELSDGDRRQPEILWLDESMVETQIPIWLSIGRMDGRHVEKSLRRIASGFQHLVERELRAQRNKQHAEKATGIPQIDQAQAASARDPFERGSKAGRWFWREREHDEERQKRG